MNIHPLLWIKIASQAPNKGIACLQGEDDAPYIALWDVPSGRMIPRLESPYGGVWLAHLSADGAWLYYGMTQDKEGNGAFFRARADGTGTPEALTPELAPYAMLEIQECYSGAFFGFSFYNENGMQHYVADAVRGGTPHLRHEAFEVSYGPYLSYAGELTVLFTPQPDPTLESYHTATGELCQRWRVYEKGEALHPVGFATREGDMRFAVTHYDAHGTPTLVLWNARTGDARRIAWTGGAGALNVLEWSHDGRTLWAEHVTSDKQARLYRYDTHADAWQDAPLVPDGRIRQLIACDDREGWALWQPVGAPSQVLRVTL